MQRKMEAMPSEGSSVQIKKLEVENGRRDKGSPKEEGQTVARS